MNKLISLAVVLSTLMPSVAFAADVYQYDAMLHIVQRYDAGTLRGDVERSQGKVSVYIQLANAVDYEQYKSILAGFTKKVDRNMKHFDWFQACVKTGVCKAPSKR